MRGLYSSIYIALQNIKSHLLHTVLSIIGIVIGVAALVAIISLTDGLEKAGREQMEQTTSVLDLSVTPVSTQVKDGIRVPVENRIQFNYEHLSTLSELLSDIAIVDLFDRSTATLSSETDQSPSYIISSTHQSKEFIEGTLIGNFINEEQSINGANVIVITKGLADSLEMNEEEIISSTLKWRDNNYKIIGYIKDSSLPISAVIPLSNAQTVKGDIYPQFTVRVAEVQDVVPAKEKIEEWISSELENSELISVSSYERRAEQFSDAFLLFKLIMGAITGISVLVGGIGVMNVLLISVTERTREIGIRKAVGGKKNHIIQQFLFESITISLVGSILGWLTGILFVFALVPIANSFINIEFLAEIKAYSIILITSIALLIGIIFGTYPAIKAANLNPVDAIRHE